MTRFQVGTVDSRRRPPGFGAKGAVLAALAVLLLLPMGAAHYGSTARPSISSSPQSPLSVAALPTVWRVTGGPSHLSMATPVSTVVFRNLPSSSVDGIARPYLEPAAPSKIWPSNSSPSAPLAATTAATPAVGPGFAGADYSNCYCAPPDVIDAAGPTQVVEMVNLWMQVWTKQGVPVHAASAGTFFGSGYDFLSDPKILYDNQSGRWFASIFDSGAGGTGLARLAVSSNSDAAGTWTIFTMITSPTGEFPDQPILGVSDQLVAVGGNMFSETTSAFFGAEYWVVDKSALLNGTAGAVQSWGPDPNYLSIHPVQSLGATATQYFVSSTSASATSVAIWAVSGVPPSATVAQANLTVATYSGAPAGRAPGGGLIDSADTRIQTALWQDGNLWMGFDVQCTPSGDSTARACVRVIEASATGPAVVQDFNYG
ncbi:MAG: hypothetical protein L3K06_06050, partial [Thermoplasmata archaeon]|nr:hypothetical protein [Thermoplasmata archaeon]